MINLLGLIEMFNTYSTNNVYHEVATCLLKHYRHLDKMTANEIADLCNVSPSTLARFFKKMDYPQTVSKLPELVSQTKLTYRFESKYASNADRDQYDSSIAHYFAKLHESLEVLASSIVEKELDQFIKDLLKCKKIVFIGCPMPQEVWRFQVDLTLYGIESSAFLDPNNHYEALSKLEEGTIVFYFHYCKSAVVQYRNALLSCKEKIFRLAIVSNGEHLPLDCDYGFTFKGTETEQDFIMMNILMNVIGVRFKEFVE
ncbi:MurR/RpiR family transcriptional regulator [Fusibacter ferrireducens]|uniref:MurR/RpiR family transcriptional regulator n=1 Tax=Fusibacter ferrireducens TaxID=2785058 RepID=A0ABR9ZQ51_9FIRM|nr:MurR/RpiR family transcriptional regulator [Fusibacter ferrireducens]MBF4692590.1 MurR/RpiR family transcriptional regulator [Fusibacter ferrireducens]